MTLHHLTHYHGEAALLAEIAALLSSSYEAAGHFALHGLTEPVPGMEHELYLLRDETGALAAFYTVGYQYIGYTLCCYLGLSAVRDDCKGQGLGGRLWATFFRDCRAMEVRIGHRILLYFTTASPIPFRWFTRTLAEAAPSATGECDEWGRHWLRTVAAAQYPRATWDAATPYLLRGAAPDVRYSAHEEQRLTELLDAQPQDFFSAVALDERRGDRLLVVGYAP